jgi:hypothetical protein
MVCAFRSKGLSEDEVVDKTNFDSVEDMCFRLERWGLSGLLPLEDKEDHKNIHASSDKPKAPRNYPAS